MTMNRLNRLAFSALTAAGLGLCLALAAPAQAQMSPEAACKDDAFRLCGNDIPDRAKVGACLRRNARSLSSACRGFVSLILNLNRTPIPEGATPLPPLGRP